jgi:hypothetical protein
MVNLSSIWKLLKSKPHKINMEKQINQAFYDEGFIPGRMISWSKSDYRQKFPENEVYFNANIFLLGEGKVWYGDVDVTRDSEILQKISTALGKSLYILRELDGRFEKEELSDSEILKLATKTINP